jgi:hypothetical protein
MDGTGKCKLPSTPPSTGLSRIQYLTTTFIDTIFDNGGEHMVDFLIRGTKTLDVHVFTTNRRETAPLPPRCLTGAFHALA